MGTKVHWTKGEHPLSVVANAFNMIAPSMSGAATVLTAFTGGLVATFGDLTAGLVMLATTWPQYKLFQLNRAHGRHTIERVKALQGAQMIERESDAEAKSRCKQAFMRIAAPLIIFGAGYAGAKLVEPPQPEQAPPSALIQRAAKPEA